MKVGRKHHNTSLEELILLGGARRKRNWSDAVLAMGDAPVKHS